MNSTEKSSRKSRDQILGVLSTKRAERLLTDWANLPESGPNPEPALRRLIYHNQDIFSHYVGGPPFDTARFNAQKSWQVAVMFGTLLRNAWNARDLRKRDWYLADAESFYHHAIGRFGDPPTQAIPVEALLYYVRRNAARMLRCPNPDCSAPYFLSTKKGQKYCSEVCARPAQLESKRRWWAEYRAKLKKGKE